MDIILTLIPAALVFSVVALIVFRWSVNSDQYDDMEGEAHRILMDDEDMIPGHKANKNHGQDTPEATKTVTNKDENS
ncbi:MAG: cbb3-type cytochrome oxidase assembly protein CcoS [Mariprofundaceae bacterium]|nr:cbb3-type cytochrome oxidase assembly protein CcoS [Mariprofundaceae bacterium]